LGGNSYARNSLEDPEKPHEIIEWSIDAPTQESVEATEMPHFPKG
jgi:hypothetical protein